jgi:xanthine/CO dehydrogenase XdhC/CoxF family maturation factor
VLVVIGGGQVGSYHARQLLKAVRGGRLPGERLLLVDRDGSCQAFQEFGGAAEVLTERAEWSDFLRGWLPEASYRDHVVPTPWAPHLLCDWLAADLRAEVVEPPRGWRLPYEVVVGDTLYLSAAAWACPATCVEPAHCPALHSPRDWDLGDLIAAEARARGYEPAVFRLRHLGGGVASIRVGEILSLRDGLRRMAQIRTVVATSSRCHAAVNAIQFFTFAPRAVQS